MTDCLFCRLVAGEEEISLVHEDERTAVFMDIQPIVPGHMLVVPRAHATYLADLDPADGASVFEAGRLGAAARRASPLRGAGGHLLVADLPRILGADGGRAAAAATRVSSAQPPTIELHWPDGREELVADSTLANLPTLDDAELAHASERLRDFERELSEIRHQLHGVIDTLDREIASRQVAGTP